MRELSIAAAVAIALIVVGVVLYAVRGPRDTAVLAPASPTPTVTRTATPTVPPTPTGLYVNQALKFSVVLPPPYRRSARLSTENSGGQRPAAADAFTARTEQDELAVSSQRCETACAIWNYVAVVDVFTGIGTQSPRDYYNAFSYNRDQQLEDITVDGHPALKVTNAPSYPIEYLIKDGDRMFILGYTIYQPGTYDVPPGASKEKLDAILTSFKFVP